MTIPGAAPCDLCGEEPAVISVMQTATFDQLVIGQNCLLPWVRALHGQLTGQQIDGEQSTGEQDAVPAADAPEAAQAPPEPQEATQEGRPGPRTRAARAAK